MTIILQLICSLILCLQLVCQVMAEPPDTCYTNGYTNVYTTVSTTVSTTASTTASTTVSSNVSTNVSSNVPQMTGHDLLGWITCPSSEPYCCYDLVGVYYCCEEKQLWTLLKVSSTIFGMVLGLAIVIVSLFALFVKIESLDPSVGFSMDDRSIRTERGANDGSLSAFFGPEVIKPEPKPEAKPIPADVKPEVNKELPKPSDNAAKDESQQASDDYKPAWGQYDKTVQKKPSEAKIDFQKKSKSGSSQQSLKAFVSNNNSSNKSKKSSQMALNVESIKKSLK